MIRFFDPSSTINDKGQRVPYKPERYKQIIREQIFISKNSAASYSDSESMTPFEREMWVKVLDDQNKEINEAINNKNKPQ